VDHRPLAQPRRFRRPARDGQQGPRLVQRVRRNRRPGRQQPGCRLGAADDHGQEHRHPQQPARRAPAQQRLLCEDEFPTITFVSTGVEQVSEVEFELAGDLTIKGVTRPVTVPFSYEGVSTDPYGNRRAGFEGSVVVNRKDWGVSWNAGLEAGGVLVSEKIALEFEVSASKNA
jgi:hypothetical protein